MNNKHFEELSRMRIEYEQLADETKALFEQFNAAQELLREVVHEMGIPDISECEGDVFSGRWNIIKYETPEIVQLLIKVSSEFGFFYANFIGMQTAHYFMTHLKKLLSQPDAGKIFDIDANDKEAVADAARFSAKMLLQHFINQLPMRFYRASIQSLDDAISGYVKRVVEPTYKERWESLGLPQEFTLMPDMELRKRDKELEDLRKMMVGLKKPEITDEIKAKLPKHHEELRKDYQQAREYHDTSREIFFRSRHSSNSEQWREKWWDISKEMFPQLHYKCLEMIAEGGYRPLELAFEHLALFYDRKPEYMRKLIYGNNTADKQKDD